MRFLPCLFVLAGCEAGITSDAQPSVTVLRQDGSCFAQIAGDSVDSTLGVSGTCSYRSNPQLLAGMDQLEIVVDYGPDVPFEASTAAPRPTITVTVDGVASDEPISISDEFRVGDRAYFIASMRAPADVSSDIRVSAGVNAGFQTLVPDVLTSIAPPVSMTLLECPATGACEIPGAVGSAHITLSVLGTVPQFVTIHARLDNEPQPDPIPPVRTFPTNSGHTEAITGIRVPSAPDDTSWTIIAQLGEAPVAQVTAVIRAPEIISRLTCTNPCTLSSGDNVGLEVVAPAGIRPLAAFVTTRINGVPQLVAVEIPLQEHADGTAIGLFALTAPAGGGSWQIDATVAGYSATTLVTNVQ